LTRPGLWEKAYPEKWLQDLGHHPIEIEGAWHRLCNHMIVRETGGELDYTLEQYGRILGVDPTEAERILSYIGNERIGDVRKRPDRVHVVSRRLSRAAKRRKSDAERKREQRASVKCPANGEGQNKNKKKSKNKKEEKTPQTPQRGAVSVMTKTGSVKVDRQRQAIAKDVVEAYLGCVKNDGVAKRAEGAAAGMLQGGWSADDLWQMVWNCQEYHNAEGTEARFRHKVTNFFGQHQECQNKKWWPTVQARAGPGQPVLVDPDGDWDF